MNKFFFRHMNKKTYYILDTITQEQIIMSLCPFVYYVCLYVLVTYLFLFLCQKINVPYETTQHKMCMEAFLNLSMLTQKSQKYKEI